MTSELDPLDAEYQALLEELAHSPKYRYRRRLDYPERRNVLYRRMVYGAAVGLVVAVGLNWLGRVLR